MKYIFFLLVLFLPAFFLFVFTSDADAQACLGNRLCRSVRWECNIPNCLPTDPGCTCGNVTRDYSVACGGIPPVCGGSPCIAGDAVLSENCYSNTPPPPPPPTDPCGGGPRTYCGGGSSPYFCCGTGVVCTPSNPTSINFTCGPPTPTPTFTPTPIPPPPCNGTCGTASMQGQSCGVNSTYQYNSSGDPFCRSLPNGNQNAYCYSCVTGPTATPTTASGSCTRTAGQTCGFGVACCVSGLTCTGGICQSGGGGGGGGGTPPPGGGGNCATTYAQCGSNGLPCCNATDFCSGAPAICNPSGGGGGGGGPTHSVLGVVFNDLNGNGFRDIGEPGVSGMSVAYTTSSGGSSNCFSGDNCQTTNGSTNGSGSYSFSGTRNTNWVTVTLTGAYSSYAFTTTGGNRYTFSNPTSNVVHDFGIWVGYSISGSIFVDSNQNGVKDGSEANYTTQSPSTARAQIRYRVGRYDDDDEEWTYLGQPLLFGSFNNSSGTYSVPGLNAGQYRVQIDPPTNVSGWTVTSLSPQIVNLGPNAVVNFGIYRPSAPTCTNITSNPSVIDSGGDTSTLTANCTAGPGTTYTWNPPSQGTTSGGTTNTTTYTSPDSSICSNANVTVSASATTPGFPSTNVSGTVTIRPSHDVTGTVLFDALNNNCSSGAFGAGAVNVRVINRSNGSTIGTSTTNGSGVYTIEDNNACSLSRDITLINGQTIKQVRVNGGAWQNVSGSTYGPFTLSATPATTIDICIGAVSPWFQTTTGDVRFSILENLLPTASSRAATDPNFPSLFFSSLLAANFGAGQSSVRNWNVHSEYNFNSFSASSLGGVSYEFYRNQAEKTGQNVIILNSPDVNLTNLANGVYRREGDITTLSGTVNSGRHIVILASGNITVSGTVSVPPNQNNLLVVAAGENITVNATVGGAASNDTTTQIDGIYSAQRSIIVSSSANCTTGTGDQRLNVGGALIANSLYPFASGGSGILDNRRTLCTNDAQYPSLKVYTRPDFLTQLTDFYKTSITTFREVNP